jgi:hypothetical protein
MTHSHEPTGPHDRRPLPLVCAEIALVFGVFFLQGAWPVPDVNETVYPAQMKHAWNPAWAPHDLYLESTDAHGVVTWLIGWLSLALPLPAFAWAGRLLTWWLLAWSWRRLSFALMPRPWWSVVSAGLFVCLQERCQMAGEWVIGGFEAKGFAYVLVFLALELLVRGRWNRALLCLGAASALHVLVGGWSALAAGAAWLVQGRERPRSVGGFLRNPPPISEKSAYTDRPPLSSLKWGLLGGFLLSLPGLWPAVSLNANATAEQVREANRIYVIERLPHHLAPQTFLETLVFKMLLLWVAFVLLWMIAPRDAGWRRLAGFVLGAAVIAAVGWLLSALTAPFEAVYTALMRFYWFRLVDAMLPLGVALGSLHWIASLRRIEPAAANVWLGLAAGIALLHLAGYAVDRPFPTRPRADRENKVPDYSAWRHVCNWVKRNTPHDALFLTPRAPQSFRWYSGRGEVVNYKDLPQDALTMLEWKRRMLAVHGAPPDSVPPRKWLKSLTERTPEQLRELGRTYDATYVVTESDPPLALPCLYRNEAYAVYALK